MSKVYIVERGAYSDRYVSGVFSSKELAEANFVLNDSDGSVEEFLIDEQAEHVKKTLYQVNIDLQTGETFGAQQHPWHGPPEVKSEAPAIKDFRSTPRGNSGVQSFGRLSAEVRSYVSAEHALKLAAECRQSFPGLYTSLHSRVKVWLWKNTHLNSFGATLFGGPVWPV